ncbi:hypothetical protein LZ32DRAFT_323845 [Colletotrichum eremochloae]|nr:hypothetical protein LZ32DRAFT_323845 [Colletotrichum eremochloae]
MYSFLFSFSFCTAPREHQRYLYQEVGPAREAGCERRRTRVSLRRVCMEWKIPRLMLFVCYNQIRKNIPTTHTPPLVLALVIFPVPVNAMRCYECVRACVLIPFLPCSQRLV